MMKIIRFDTSGYDSLKLGVYLDKKDKYIILHDYNNNVENYGVITSICQNVGLTNIEKNIEEELYISLVDYRVFYFKFVTLSDTKYTEVSYYNKGISFPLIDNETLIKLDTFLYKEIKSRINPTYEPGNEFIYNGVINTVVEIIGMDNEPRKKCFYKIVDKNGNSEIVWETTLVVGINKK